MFTRPHYFITLDGMRGVAAMAVVAFHADDYLSGCAPHSAYLAVDFFFGLSGFVLAHAYDNRIDQGLRPHYFLKLRLLRLYPLYLAGTLLMIAAVLGAAAWGGWAAAKWTPQRLAVSVPLALLMLPSPATINMFPLNIPAWSLFDELVVNVAYAARLLRGYGMALIVTLAAVLLAAANVYHGSWEQGAFWSSAVIGLARVLYSFPIGVLLYRLHASKRWMWRIPTPIPLAILLGLLFVSLPSGPGRALYDIGFALVLSPLLIFIGAQVTPRQHGMVRIFSILGFLSYPLYILQAPVISVLRNELKPTQGPFLGLAYLAAMVAVAWMFGLGDAWARRWLGLNRRRQDRPTVAGTIGADLTAVRALKGFHHDGG